MSGRQYKSGFAKRKEKEKKRATGLPPGWFGNNQKAKYWGYWQLKGKGLRGYHSG